MPLARTFSDDPLHASAPHTFHRLQNSGTKISLMVPTTPTMSPQPALEMSVTAASP